jgi:uroporphyrinogen decarboxylase
MLNSTQRIRALLTGREIDRTPIAGWFHMPLVDQNVTDFTREIINTTDYYGWDFLKIMSNGHYPTAAYGGKIKYSTNSEKWNGDIYDYPVKQCADLEKLSVLTRDNAVFRHELAIVSELYSHYRGDIPLIATIFNPITFLQELISSLNPAPVLELICNNRALIHKTLKVLLETNLMLIDAFVEKKADGIFYVNQFASRNVVNAELFDEFSLPYDEEILRYLDNKTWFNIIHLHGTGGLYFEKYTNLPFQAFSWECCPSNTDANHTDSLTKVKAMFNKVLITGIDQNTDFISPENDRAAVKRTLQMRYANALRENGGNRFIFAPGCALPLNTPRYFFRLIKDVVECK